jgi:hypothetical protein
MNMKKQTIELTNKQYQMLLEIAQAMQGRASTPIATESVLHTLVELELPEMHKRHVVSSPKLYLE